MDVDLATDDITRKYGCFLQIDLHSCTTRTRSDAHTQSAVVAATTSGYHGPSSRVGFIRISLVATGLAGRQKHGSMRLDVMLLRSGVCGDTRAGEARECRNKSKRRESFDLACLDCKSGRQGAKDVLHSAQTGQLLHFHPATAVCQVGGNDPPPFNTKLGPHTGMVVVSLKCPCWSASVLTAALL